MSDRKEKMKAHLQAIPPWLRDNRGKLIEHGKSLLIILLFLSAFFLAGQSGLFNGEARLEAVKDKLSSVFSGGNGSGNSVGNREYAEAAIPMVVTVSPEEGTRYAVAYSAQVETIFRPFSAYLGEALGSAEPPVSVSRSEWERVLTGAGVFIDYVFPQNLRCIAAWQGTDAPENAGDHYVRRLFLAAESVGIKLYYISEDTGTVYRCATALAGDAMESLMTAYQSNNAQFAFENQDYASLEPDTVILPGATEVKRVTVNSPGAPTDVEELLGLFGMNYITASHYLETDGSMVYLEGDSTLHIGTDGVIRFERDGEKISTPEEWKTLVSLPDVVDSLFQTTQDMVAETVGEARIVLSEARYQQRIEQYTVSFDYLIDGMRVCLPTGSAAEYTVSNGQVIEAVVRLRQYQLAGETQTPLPIVQAAALVEVSGGSEPVQVYQDTGDSVTVSWMIQ